MRQARGESREKRSESREERGVEKQTSLSQTIKQTTSLTPITDLKNRRLEQHWAWIRQREVRVRCITR